MGRLIVLVLIGVILVCQLTTTVDALTYADLKCVGKNLNYTSISVYDTNHRLVLNQLTSKSSSVKFYSYTVGDGSNKVYGLFQCRYDVSLDICSQCVKTTANEVSDECLDNNGEAIEWYYECMVRFSNRNIFSLSETSPMYHRSVANVTDSSEASEISMVISGLINNITSASPPFISAETALTGSKRLYSYAQCTPDIPIYECYNCLSVAFSNWTQCCSDNQAVMIFMPSCQLRYDMTGPFLYDFPPPAQPTARSPPRPQVSLKPAIIAAVAAGASVGLIIISIALWMCLCRKKSNTQSNTRVPHGLPNHLLDGSGVAVLKRSEMGRKARKDNKRNKEKKEEKRKGSSLTSAATSNKPFTADLKFSPPSQQSSAGDEQKESEK